MSGSPDNWSTDTFGWLTKWRGLAPTSWLYFGIKGLPFPLPTRDVDHDGMPDWCEYMAGTNPKDPSSVFRVNASYDSTTHAFKISWPGVSNRLYTVLISTNLASGWFPVPGQVNIPGTGQSLEFIKNVTGTGMQVYRVACSRVN